MPPARHKSGQAGEDRDGRHHAELGRHQQAGKNQPQSEVDELAAGVADEYSLGAVADFVAETHVGGGVGLEVNRGLSNICTLFCLFADDHLVPAAPGTQTECGE